MKIDSAKKKVEALEQKWSVYLSFGRTDISVSPEAVSSNRDRHSHALISRLVEKEIEKEIDSALQISRKAQADFEKRHW
jgi:hypothetical protein